MFFWVIIWFKKKIRLEFNQKGLNSSGMEKVYFLSKNLWELVWTLSSMLSSVVDQTFWGLHDYSMALKLHLFWGFTKMGFPIYSGITRLTIVRIFF